MVQRLRLHLPVQGRQVQSLVRELRPRMSWATKAKHKVSNIITIPKPISILKKKKKVYLKFKFNRA